MPHKSALGATPREPTASFPQLLAVFFAEFHPTQGPKVTFETPAGFVASRQHQRHRSHHHHHHHHPHHHAHHHHVPPGDSPSAGVPAPLGGLGDGLGSGLGSGLVNLAGESEACSSADLIAPDGSPPMMRTEVRLQRHGAPAPLQIAAPQLGESLDRMHLGPAAVSASPDTSAGSPPGSSAGSWSGSSSSSLSSSSLSSTRSSGESPPQGTIASSSPLEAPVGPLSDVSSGRDALDPPPRSRSVSGGLSASECALQSTGPSPVGPAPPSEPDAAEAEMSDSQSLGELVDGDAGVRALAPLDFDAVSEFIIPKPELCHRLVTAHFGEYKVMGFPQLLAGSKYPRNALLFNLCFVLHRDADARAFKPVVRKAAHFLRDLEVESEFLHRPETKQTLRTLVERLLEDLNLYAECCIPVNDANMLNLKLFLQFASPPADVAWDLVPILAAGVSRAAGRHWDLTVQTILPFINGVNHVRRISELADVDVRLVQVAVQHLVYYGVCRLVDWFQLDNVYALAPDGLAALQRQPDWARRALAFCRSADLTVGDGVGIGGAHIAALFASFDPGHTVAQVVQSQPLLQPRVEVSGRDSRGGVSTVPLCSYLERALPLGSGLGGTNGRTMRPPPAEISAPQRRRASAASYTLSSASSTSSTSLQAFAPHSYDGKTAVGASLNSSSDSDDEALKGLRFRLQVPSGVQPSGRGGSAGQDAGATVAMQPAPLHVQRLVVWGVLNGVLERLHRVCIVRSQELRQALAIGSFAGLHAQLCEAHDGADVYPELALLAPGSEALGPDEATAPTGTAGAEVGTAATAADGRHPELAITAAIARLVQSPGRLQALANLVATPVRCDLVCVALQVSGSELVAFCTWCNALLQALETARGAQRRRQLAAESPAVSSTKTKRTARTTSLRARAASAASATAGLVGSTGPAILFMHTRLALDALQ